MDAFAHRAALKTGLPTIGVPGSGLGEKSLYPATNRVIAKEIVQAGGSLISEFPDDFHPHLYSFPQRNRIMAGVANAVLIIEAVLKSGTLITSRLATDYNRDVLAVPGSIFSKNSEGPHMLIKLGATPATSAEDVLDTLGLTVLQSPADIGENLSEQEKTLLALLASPRSHDELLRALTLQSGLATESANALIMTLELQGYISKSGGIFIRKR